MSIVLLMLCTALASSGLTLGLAWLAWRRWLEPRLDARLLELQDEFEKRVKSGVLAAGEELLPAFREQVSAGFRDVLKLPEAADLVQGGAKVVTRSADLLEQGLGAIFGLKPTKR
ncbi:MAG: hypothetical protein HYV18_08750 [Gammaproteobacteria bacterium]|nr:hypothetical protein [Gammaproteobacteria bacterium]